MMTREMWYNIVAKFQGREPKDTNYYRINEADNTASVFVLELGGGRKVVFNKIRNSADVWDGEELRIKFTLSGLKKIFEFAKKNGVI